MDADPHYFELLDPDPDLKIAPKFLGKNIFHSYYLWSFL
jgi:hypothetical protein